MHPPDCPSWEYSFHPQAADILKQQCNQLLIALRQGNIDPLESSCDTRSAHTHVFSKLAPQYCLYYAGHYRGEAFRCLEFYNVRIQADPLVGEDASKVGRAMVELSMVIRNGVAALDIAHQLPEAQVPRWQKVYYLVMYACRIFVEFLRIHPYANGNGHMGRLIIWGLLGRYGLWPRRWPFNERPPDPPYSHYIHEYRRGNRDLLEQFVLKCILGS